MQDKKALLNECIESMVTLYYYQTISLLDYFLTDDLENPRFSALATCNRLNEYLLYQELQGNQKKDIPEHLSELGYSQEDIDLLMARAEQEKKNGCIDRIVKTYFYNVITLLDCVLTDDLEDPQYSAITACNRLNEYLHYQELQGDQKKDALEFLGDLGYSQEDIDLLMAKVEKEKELKKEMSKDD